MSINLDPLLTAAETRLLFSVKLQPLQTHRFQPTGFPDLGAALYQAGSKTCLLVESAQSMANRLEAVCWDATEDQLVPCLAGLSYIRVEQDDKFLTSTLVESHRINSPYILESKDDTFSKALQAELATLKEGPIDRRLLAATLFKYDVNALIHGVFLAKKELAGGRLRVARALSSFVEADGVQTVLSGGVKNDHVNPSGEASQGFGNVPFSREEFTADNILAHFNIDLAQIRGYGLDEPATRLLILLSLYKVRSLLSGNLRFRTACDLEVIDTDITATRPTGFQLPTLSDLQSEIADAINACQSLFAGSQGVTTVKYVPGKSKK